MMKEVCDEWKVSYEVKLSGMMEIVNGFDIVSVYDCETIKMTLLISVFFLVSEDII